MKYYVISSVNSKYKVSYVSDNIGSGNGLLSNWHQTITWFNAD